MADDVCVVVGVGPGTGEALARRFADGGYRVALMARSKGYLDELADELDGAVPVPCDVSDEAAVRAAFATVREQLGPVSVLCYNAGVGSFSSFRDTEVADLERAMQVNVYGLLVAGQEAVADMLDGDGGAVVVTGATASLRGGAGFAGFAPAKAAQRILAESMARSLGPEGVHVGYLVVDGVIDTPRVRDADWAKDKPDDFFLDPEAIADAAWFLAHQERSAWTFQLDVRPYGESW